MRAAAEKLSNLLFNWVIKKAGLLAPLFFRRLWAEGRSRRFVVFVNRAKMAFAKDFVVFIELVFGE